nr:structural maintenance of chromosomes protein 2-1-like [Tanacetum cinerariifolium]
MALFAFIRHSDPQQGSDKGEKLISVRSSVHPFSHIWSSVWSGPDQSDRQTEPNGTVSDMNRTFQSGLQSSILDQIECQEGSTSYIDDISTATKPHLDKAHETLASCMKEAVIAYQNMRPSTMMRKSIELQLLHMVHEAIWTTLLLVSLAANFL